MIKSIKNFFFKKPLDVEKNDLSDVHYVVGIFTLTLPSIHKLPEYQKSFKNYDKQLKSIVNVVIANKDQDVVIDIGANIGDTAAFIRTYSDCKIYCVEGDPYYLNYLKTNCNIIPNVTIIDSYVSGNKNIESVNIVRSNGTSRICETNSDSDMSNSKLESLEVLMKQNYIIPQFVKLLKLDTDGMDFIILLNSEQLIRNYKFNLYFEYDLFYDQDALINSHKLIDLLSELGYGFIVYDNFGNLLTKIDFDSISRFTELNNYLLSCRKNGGGLFYYDIFASIDSKHLDNIHNLNINQL